MRLQFDPYWVLLYLQRSEEHTSELQSRRDLVCRLLLEKKNCQSPAFSARRRHCAAARLGQPAAGWQHHLRSDCRSERAGHQSVRKAWLQDKIEINLARR